MFMSIMLDQGAFWRSGETIDITGVTLGGDAMQYASSDKSRKPEHPAFKAIAKAPPIQPPRWRAWATGFDGTWKLGADNGSAGLTHNTGGLAAGVDYQIAPDLLLGAAMGGSSSNFSVRDRGTSGHLDAVHLGGYGVKTWGSTYAAGALGFSTIRNDTSRTIAGLGPAQVATGNFGSNLLSGRLEVGSTRPFGRVAVTPFVAVQFAELWQSGYTEANVAPAGAGPLGLSYAAQTAASLPTFLGAQVDGRFDLPFAAVSPYARLSWMHEFSPTRQISPSFIGLPGTSFTVVGAPAARDAAKVEVGSKLAISRSVKAFVSFDGAFAERSEAYAGKGGFNFVW
jgi:outer membrane autotransporter protein